MKQIFFLLCFVSLMSNVEILLSNTWFLTLICCIRQSDGFSTNFHFFIQTKNFGLFSNKKIKISEYPSECLIYKSDFVMIFFFFAIENLCDALFFAFLDQNSRN
ncbi:hypothetical protein HanLR1_Chr02g0043171 [Helianthus annuus]|nr:hypothetical protein HanHA89_Chr02g0044611 [Helianthus annuus]KAJ0776227.1 hypothetical protein HanLR1_Chr02g0043171 [Helianthus annuus]